MRPGAAPGACPGAGNATTDEELLAEIARGREDAVGKLYARLAPAVFAIAVPALDSATAEEIVQDVFVAAWRSAGSFDPQLGTARTWLFTIARRRIANELRRRSRRPRTESGSGEEDSVTTGPDPAPDPSEALWRERRGEILRRALRELPPPERAALGLAYFDDVPHREIAELLRIPLGTAKSRIRSGVARLRLRLGPLVAAVAIGVLAALLVSRLSSGRRQLGVDERALEMLTSSDAQSLRMTASPEAPPDAHATYRFRPGSPIAVVTLSRFPAASPGEVDRAWALAGGRWVLLGEARPDASGRARRIAEDSALASPPARLVVTRETGPAGSAPAGRTMVSWEADRK
jgi:RNA polymerase sigma-70 factor (ECF subfamily)